MDERNKSFEVVREVLDCIIDQGATILHNKFLQSQRIPYASRTLARELVMNATWALAPLDDVEIETEPDDDLVMPPIDEWAGGVLPVRDPDATGLRTAVNPVIESKKPPQSARNNVKPPANSPAKGNSNPVKPPSEPSSARTRSTRIPREGNTSTKAKKVKPPPTEAETIMKTFEEVRKRSTTTTKAVTVDAEFNVIQIQEPHGLPPSLIVPRITTKKAAKTEKPQPMINRAPRPSIKKPDTSNKKRPTPRLIDADVPKFDNEIAEVTFADKIVCAPGVTFRDGNAVKSRPPQNNANQLTRMQYEEYLEEMKRTADVS